MSDFFKKFLVEDARRLNSSGRFAALAAFGKHPGWDDHVEDLGLETESLIIAKTLLYINGIGRQIDSGAWEKLDPAQQLPAFKHVFVWQRSGQILVGRLWSSSDGKGRKRYPMVVCAHFAGVTLGWALKQALPALAELEQGCAMTTSAEEVRALLARKRAALREALQTTDGRGEYAPASPDTLHTMVRPAGNGGPESILRVLYQVQSQMRNYAPGAFNARANVRNVRAQQIRVPAGSPNPEQALLFWTRFFLAHIDSSAPLLLTLPLEENWVDVTVGEPESQEFFCLRASPKAMPLVSEVPYTFDEAFRAGATTFLDRFQKGEATTGFLATAPAAAAPEAGKSRWRTWFGLFVFLAVGAAAAVFLVPGLKEKITGQSSPAPKPQIARTNESAPSVAAATNDPAAEVARLAEQARQSSAEAAAKLKPEAEEKERERQRAETTRLERERLERERLARVEQERLEKERLEKERLEKERVEKERLERQAAEAARLEREKQAAAQKEAERQAAETARRETAAAAQTAAAGTAGTSPAPIVMAGEMTNSIGMVFAPLPSGIWVSKYEVTQAEYRKVMGTNPSKSVNERQPVEQVSWKDATEFTRKLSEMEKGRLPAGRVYALPTEKQWQEFAGGQKFEDLPGRGFTGRSRPATVGQSGPANKFGLFDVLGNVWEWCLDGTNDQKKLKGGAFNSVRYEQLQPPDSRLPNGGFRCVVVAAE